MANTNNHSEHAVGKEDVSALWQDSLNQSVRALEDHDYKKGDNAKLFGLVEMDSGIVSALNMLYTTFGGEATKRLSPHTYGTMIKYGGKVPLLGQYLHGERLNRAAAGTALGVNLAFLLAPSVSELTQTLKDHHKERKDMARSIAPVLDDLVGSHSIGALMGVKASGKGGNSVIYAHRRRMHKEHSTYSMNVVLKGIGSNLINVLREGTNVSAMLSGRPRHEIEIEKQDERAGEIRAKLQDKYADNPEALEYKVAEQLRKDDNMGGAQFGWMGGTAAITSLVNAVAKSSVRRLEANRQPYSALEMIKALADQVEHNPGGANYFQLPGSRGQQMPLAQYVMEVFKHHQREMADIDPKQSEIRAALDPDLKAIALAIAEKIEQGEMSPLALVHLAGEGRVVRANGRGIASLDEVKAQLDRYTERSRNFNVENHEDFLKERNFDQKAVKEALKHLEGAERLDFAGTLPDQVLTAAGLSDKEVKEVQAHRVAEGFGTMLNETLMGMAALDDKELHNGGLGKSQIERLRQTADQLKLGGDEAMQALQAASKAGDGVEHIVTDFVVPKISADRQYLGTLRSQGRAFAETAPSEQAAPQGFAEKHAGRAAEFADNDHEFAAEDDLAEESFAEREHGRRGGQHAGHRQH